MAKKGTTGSAGRFGARYGRVARRRVAEIEEDTNAEHTCPSCGKPRVERSVRQELDEIEGDRTTASLGRDGTELTVHVDAADLVALRAGINTWSTLVEVAERVVGVA